MADVATAFPQPTQTCKKCHESIYEGHAYELGDDRWHIQCFKCFKCDKALGCNSNFLVLGNGSLVCSSCSYNCKQCGKKIDDLAILTGDKAYCSSCFKCRVCKLKIEDLRYARTSKGLFCMSCHEDLLAKKKKHDLKKKQKEQLLLLLRPSAPLPALASTGSDHSSSAQIKPPLTNGIGLGPAPDLPQRSALPSLSKNLPQQSTPKDSATGRPSAGLAQSSSQSIGVASAAHATIPSLAPSSSSLLTSLTKIPLPHMHETISVDSELTFDSPITTTDLQPHDRDADTDRTEGDSLASMRMMRERLERRFEQLLILAEPDGAILDLIESFSEPTTPITEVKPADSNKISKDTKNGTTSESTTPGALNGPSVGSLAIPQTSPQKSTLDQVYPGKNITIMSPGQLHDNELYSTGLVGLQTALPSDESVRPRSSISSPMAKANRQARVVETIDDAAETSLEKASGAYLLQSAITTPKKAAPHSGPITSPPPLLALPQVPTTPASRGTGSAAASERAELYEPRGLGLKGMEFMKLTHTVKEATPAVSNLEDTIPNDAGDDDTSRPSRSKSTRSKLLLRHKRSISGGLTSGSLLSRLGFFRSKDDGEKGHSRHVLEGLINGQAFTTPPLPFLSPFRQSVYRELQTRLTSETPFLTETDLDFDLGLLKSELVQLESRRLMLLADNMRLNSDRSRMRDTINSLELKINSDVDRLEAVRSEIAALQGQQQRLKDENKLLEEERKGLEERNHALEESNRMLEEIQKRLESGSAAAHATPKNENISTYGNRASQYFDVTSDHLENMSALDAVSEDAVETQKATRLRFWRRPKVSLTGANSGSNNGSNTSSGSTNGWNANNANSNNSTNNNNYGNHVNGGGNGSDPTASKMSTSVSTNSLHPSSVGNVSDQDSGGAFKSFNSLITKSRSTNLLESFVSGPGGGSSGPGGDVPLFSSTIQRRAVYEGQKVPLIVTKCIDEVEKRGMDVEGIYRLSGGNSAVVAIENAFAALPNAADRKQLNKLYDLLAGDINAVTSALKRYLRKLPDPLIPYALYPSYTKVGQQKGDTAERCQELLTRVILRLPAANKHALYLIGKHLDNVNYYSSVNRMNFKNLSVVFAPTIARDPTGEREIVDMGARNEATELLFANFASIFGKYTPEN